MPVVPCWSGREFRFEFDRAALVVVDMQRDFFSGSVGALTEVLPAVAAVLTSARAAGLRVIHTREGYAADGTDVNAYKRHLGYVGRPGPNGPYLVRGSHGHGFVPGFESRDDEPVIDKAGFSAFFRTDLEDLLEGMGISHLILVGVTTQACVMSTLRDAVDRGFFCLTVADACAAEQRSVHEAALETIQAENHLFGWLASSSDVREALAGA